MGRHPKGCAVLAMSLLISSAVLLAPVSTHATSSLVLSATGPAALRQSTVACAGFGGSWSNSTATCVVSESAVIGSGSDLTIEPRAQLVVDFNATLEVSGVVNVNGSTVANTGTISISAAGVLDNTGLLGNNYGVLTNSGIFDNGPNGTLANFGVVLDRYGGALQNAGLVTNAGLIEVTSGSSLTNLGRVFNGNGSSIANFGILANGAPGSIVNLSTLADGCGGVFDNSGSLSGNPAEDNCHSPAGIGPGAASSSTSTVPEFPSGSVGALALLALALAVALANRGSGLVVRSPRTPGQAFLSTLLRTIFPPPAGSIRRTSSTVGLAPGPA